MTFTIDTVFVWITDLDRSVAWYREFGIEAGPRHGTWQTMTTDGTTRFGLHQGERQRDDPTAAIAFGANDRSPARMPINTARALIRARLRPPGFRLQTPGFRLATV